MDVVSDTTVTVDGQVFSEGSIMLGKAGAERVRIKSIGRNGMPDLFEVWDGARYVERVPEYQPLSDEGGVSCGTVRLVPKL